MSKVIKSIPIKISWVFATKVYIEVLRNPNASIESISGAKEDLLKLAKWADKKMEDSE